MALRKLCKYCGKAYKAKSDTQICCSDVCGFLLTKKEETDKKKKWICIVCGNEFTRRRKNQQHCSDKCKDIIDIENNKVGEFIILNRDNFTCVYCGRSPVEDGIKLHLDHVIPISKGGESNAANLVTSCHNCNLEKGNRIINSDKILQTIKIRNKKNNIPDGQLFKNRAFKNRIGTLVDKTNINPSKFSKPHSSEGE